MDYRLSGRVLLARGGATRDLHSPLPTLRRSPLSEPQFLSTYRDKDVLPQDFRITS